MSSSEVSAKVLCESILAMSPEQRYKRLKALDGNELFCEVIRMLPSQVRQEFGSFEKRADLEASLRNEVSLATMQQLIKSGISDLGPTSLTTLLDRWSAGDEFWLFDSFPGDRGYALLREGRILDYSIIEVRNT